MLKKQAFKILLRRTRSRRRTRLQRIRTRIVEETDVQNIVEENKIAEDKDKDC